MKHSASHRRVKTPYPLLSILTAFLLLGYFYLSSQPDLIRFYAIPAFMLQAPVPEVLCAVFALVVLLELRNVQIQRQHQQSIMQRVEEQIEELLDTKKQLHAKAHVYANHAEKLKLFISDKLLEYIEYDEKFLHFKSIASEVRHNGVISYDKLTTLLDQQLNAVGVVDLEEVERLQEARDSLRYLWDLLDLSTADNIALHIANQVCESEEIIFQSELDNNQESIPERPVFAPRAALVKALQRCFGSTPQWLDDTTLQMPEHDWVWIQAAPTDDLLGNENHIVLALENLISNAQFFTGRVNSRKVEKRARIAVLLDQQQGYIRYQIYNRGPHINDNAAHQLFQLGYSTRRAKEHHGKGLGLYFVNEIIKGYDGNIAFSNIHNSSDVLSLRIETDSGEVITEVIELVIEEDTPLCRKSGSDVAARQLDWVVSGKLVSLEITHQSDQQTHRQLHEALQRGTLYDPGRQALPRWQMQMESKRKKSTDLIFKPLDCAGVLFEINLPGLNARLEGDLLTANEDDMARQVDMISSRFQRLSD